MVMRYGQVGFLAAATCVGPFLVSEPVFAQGQGYALAAACTSDVWRDASLGEAETLIVGVEALVAFDGPGPVYPALGEAISDMDAAWRVLEQILNQGMLKWSFNCASCDPEKGTPVSPSYLDLAQRLVDVSREVHDDPAYDEYLGLVETTVANRAALDYCGFYVAGLTGSQHLDEVEGCYAFRETDGTLLTLNLRLRDLLAGIRPNVQGFLVGNRPSGDQATWWLLGDEIVLLGLDRRPASVLHQVDEHTWSGPAIAEGERTGFDETHEIKRRVWVFEDVVANASDNPDIFHLPEKDPEKWLTEIWYVSPNGIRLQFDPKIPVPPELFGVSPIFDYRIDNLATRLIAGEHVPFADIDVSVTGFDVTRITMSAWGLSVGWSAQPALVLLGQWDTKTGRLQFSGTSTSLTRNTQLKPPDPFPLDAVAGCTIPEDTDILISLTGGAPSRPGDVTFIYKEE